MTVIILIMIGLFFAFRYFESSGKGATIKLTNMNEALKIVKEIKTDENTGRIENLINYHNNRVNAGAVSQESYERLVKELNEIKNGER